MSSDKYVASTLELPPQIPLFKYKVDFGGLKSLLEQLNIHTNTNSDSIKKITDDLKTKHTIEEFKNHQKVLNNSINFGLNVQKYVHNDENKFMQININPKEQKSNTDQFAYKLSKINQIVDYLLMKVAQNQEKLNADDRKNQNMINDSFKRLQDKIQSSLSSFNKTISNYFNQTNKKSANIESEFNMLQSVQNNKINQMQDQLNTKLSTAALDSALQAFKHKILNDMDAQITADQMKRMAAIEEYNTQLKQFQKSIDLQNKVTKQKVNELQQKVKTGLPNKVFEMQKHKIFEKLSQFKNKTDQLSRKNGQFVEFRKTYLVEKQKMKQQFIGFEEEINKLNMKESSFKKMENVSDILEKLDPHLICEIGNQVKLHEKEIGKLQKKLMDLQHKAKDSKQSQSQVPQINTGENSEAIQKILKEYMSNMDFEGRVKKIQKELYQTSRRADSFYDLEKKIYTLSKQIDVSVIMKELKRKCDEQMTKKELKIIDTKIESLFDYFRTLRKQMQMVYKRTAMSSIKDSPDNPSLTSKKLLGVNCLSCTPNHSKRRVFSRQKLDFSLDEGQDYLKSSTYQKFK